jgi:hypothetical protein
MGFVRQGDARATVPARKETRGGVWYGDEGENREPTSVPRKEGHTVQGARRVQGAYVCRARVAAADAAPPSMASPEYVVTATRQM